MIDSEQSGSVAGTVERWVITHQSAPGVQVRELTFSKRESNTFNSKEEGETLLRVMSKPLSRLLSPDLHATLAVVKVTCCAKTHRPLFGW